MPSFDVDREQVNLFRVEDRYLFKQYFDQDKVFTALRDYYNQDDYRFEVPPDAVEEVKQVLREHMFEPVVVDAPTEFCVVYPKYTDHPDVLFKAAVLQRSKRDKHLFLLKDRFSVEQAVNNGATRLADTDLDTPF
jgi:hypothetical protein